MPRKNETSGSGQIGYRDMRAMAAAPAPALSKLLLHEALGKLDTVRSRYGMVKELGAVWATIDAALTKNKRGRIKLRAQLTSQAKKTATVFTNLPLNCPMLGCSQIAAFLGEPTSVVQRWASEGIPVRRQDRYVETVQDELNAWLGKESGTGARSQPRAQI